MKREIDYKALGQRIKAVRVDRGMTQEALAETINCHTSHISNIENGYTKGSLNALLAIANALDTSVDSLLNDQYARETSAIDSEIIRALQTCSEEKKGKILKIIRIL